MRSWEKFNETSLPNKKAFYSQLNLEDITDKDYAHKSREVFEIKNLGECHDLYVLSDTLLLANVFENFRDKCIEIYRLDPAHFLSVSGLAWQACLKKTGLNLKLLTDIDMVLMVEEGIRGGICQAIYRYATVNNKYMNNYDKSTESSHLTYLDAKSLYGWAMSQKLPINGFKWVEDLSELNENFIKNYDENSDTGFFLEVDVEYSKNLFNLQNVLLFLPESKELINIYKYISFLTERKQIRKG